MQFYACIQQNLKQGLAPFHLKVFPIYVYTNYRFHALSFYKLIYTSGEKFREARRTL